MKQFLVLILLLSCTAAYSQTKKQAGADPWAGNWKLDTAKSKIQAACSKRRNSYRGLHQQRLDQVHNQRYGC